MVRDHNSPSLTGQVGYALEGGFMNTNDIVLAIAFGASLVRMKGIAVTAQSAYGCAMIGQYSS